MTEPLTVSIQRGQAVSIRTGDQTIEVVIAADTVGEALATAGISLQDQDFSTPSEDEPIPEDRIIKVTRVSEETILEENVIPFTKERVSDPDIECRAGKSSAKRTEWREDFDGKGAL